MSGIVRAALGQPGRRAADLILAATRPPGGGDPFHRAAVFPEQTVENPLQGALSVV